MSVLAMAAVFARSASKGSARLVLLALADVANDEGEVSAYKRSQAILASKANVDTKTVPKAIAALVKLGEVEVLAKGDGRRSTDYRILLVANEGPPSAPPPDAGAGSADGGGTPRQIHPQGPPDAPPIIPSSTSSSDPLPLEGIDAPPAAAVDRFDEWWELYPRSRRTGKADARRAWDRAIKRADPEVIIAGLRRYIDETEGADPRYLKTPGPWLNDDRFLDEPGANRRAGRGAPGPAARRPIHNDRTAPGGRVDPKDL